MTEFSRSLREFIRSRQFEQFRALADALRRPQRLALDVSHHLRPQSRTGVHLELTTFHPRSIGQVHLHVPSDTTVPESSPTRQGEPLDLERLRATVRESEIDFAELIDAVNDVVASRRRSAKDPDGLRVSVAEIATAHPPTQGLASIVGLLVLGARYGSPGDLEIARWTTASGSSRHARITSFVFTEEIA